MVLASWHTSLYVSPNHISGSTISKPQNSVEKDDQQILYISSAQNGQIASSKCIRCLLAIINSLVQILPWSKIQINTLNFGGSIPFHNKLDGDEEIPT